MQFLKELGWGIVVFGLVIGVGLVVLSKFADTVGAGTANTTIQYIMTQLGSSGLAGWIGIVIVIVLGAWAIASFGGFGGRR